MKPTKLIDVVANIFTYDNNTTIYASKPWTCNSNTILAQEPAEGGRPAEAELCGAEYLIEVFIAKEFLEDWLAQEGRPISTQEQCERLIHYAIYDA
ncbi:hypothetical protein [Sorangium sp. So ce385]|uniref:hypothetical protein n=1 Tax=Sorangium sp. So ce385 TaxID=3133308 RepID=UPI003F5C32C3